MGEGIPIRGPGRDPNKAEKGLVPRGLAYKGVGAFVILLRGVNFGVWSHLGCSGENIIILYVHCSRYVAMKVSFGVSCQER